VTRAAPRPTAHEVLEPAVAALEAAIHELERAPGDPRSEEALRLLETAHRELVQQWFARDVGQDVLFG